MESTWNVVHDCDTEDGSPTCWAKRTSHPTYGQFVWISQYSDGEYAVEVIPVNDIGACHLQIPVRRQTMGNDQYRIKPETR